MSTTFWIQLLGIIFGVAMLYFTFVKYKRRELGSMELWMWSGGWILLILVAIAPYTLDPIIAPLNFYRRLDFFVVIGFFVLFALGFYNYISVKRIEHKVEVLVRKQAFHDASEEHKK